MMIIHKLIRQQLIARLLIVMLALCATLVVTVRDGGATPKSESEFVACRATDAYATNFRDYVASIVSADDSASLEAQLNWNLLPAADTAVQYVADSSACDLAARVHAAKVEKDTVNPAPVLLLRVGASRYITYNGTRIGEFYSYVILDSAFTYISTVGS